MSTESTIQQKVKPRHRYHLLTEYDFDLVRASGFSNTQLWNHSNQERFRNLIKLLRREPKQLTDKMVLIAARVMNDRQADDCNVDREDQWKIYGQEFIEDAKAMLEAAYNVTN